MFEFVLDIECVMVIGSCDFFFNNGLNFVFGELVIENMLIFNCDIKDIVCFNFLVVVSVDGEELSIVGFNFKYNIFIVDGVGVNDMFGL